MTSSVGTVDAEDVLTPTGQSATSSVGSVVIETAYDITGVSATDIFRIYRRNIKSYNNTNWTINDFQRRIFSTC